MAIGERLTHREATKILKMVHVPTKRRSRKILMYTEICAWFTGLSPKHFRQYGLN